MGARRGRRVLCGAVLAAAIASVGVVPVAADTNLVIGGQAVVAHTDNGVNVRAAVGSSAKLLFSLPQGAKVKVIGGPNTASDGSLWYNVDVNGTLGWIISDYLSLPAVAQGQTLTVTGTGGNGLRLRDAASLSSNTLTVMPDGATLTVAGADVADSAGNTWAHVTYNGTTGYASREYLAAGGAAPTQTVTVKVATVAATTEAAPKSASSGIAVGGNAEVTNTNGDGLNLRSDAGYGSSVLTVAGEGDIVQVAGGPTSADGASWWEVDYKGMKGWMDADYLVATDKQPTQAANVASVSNTTSPSSTSAPASSAIGQQIVAEAMKFLGYPYVWGGTTPAGFDCSGFVYYVVNQVTGGGFPRDMASQVTSGTYVDAKDLQPGDLVFQQNTYQWGLSHAGIYIGNGQFIDAANESTGVTINNLWDSYWGPRYYTARRIGG